MCFILFCLAQSCGRPGTRGRSDGHGQDPGRPPQGQPDPNARSVHQCAAALHHADVHAKTVFPCSLATVSQLIVRTKVEFNFFPKHR
jgi:hypothetical protein